MGGYYNRFMDWFNPGDDYGYDKIKEDEEERERLERETYKRSFGENLKNLGSGIGATFGGPKRAVDYSTAWWSNLPPGDTPPLENLFAESLFPKQNEEENIYSSSVKQGLPVLYNPKVEAAARGISRLPVAMAADPMLPVTGGLGKLANTAMGAYFGSQAAGHAGELGGEIWSEAIDQEKGFTPEIAEKSAEAIGSLGMAGMAGVHAAKPTAKLAREAIVGPEYHGPVARPKPYAEKISELENPDRQIYGGKDVKESNKRRIEEDNIPEKLDNNFTGWKEFPGSYGTTWKAKFKNGQREIVYGVKPESTNSLGNRTKDLDVVLKDEHVGPGSLDPHHPVTEAYSKMGQDAAKGELNLDVDTSYFTPGSTGARKRYIPTDETASMALTAAKESPQKLAGESRFLPGTDKEGAPLTIEDVGKGVRDITVDAGKELSPEAMAVRNTIDSKYAGNVGKFKENYGVKPENINDLKVDMETGVVSSEKRPWTDLPIGEALEKILPEGTPSSQRGAIGPDLSKIDAFENGQQRKYGKDWRTKQSPEEADFHRKLLVGKVEFKTEQPRSASTEPEIFPEEAELPVTESEPRVDRVIERPDGTKLRIETTEDNQIRVTNTRPDGSIISVREGPDFDSLSESFETIDLSKETPLSKVREQAAERENAFKKNVRLTEQLIKAQNAEEARAIIKEKRIALKEQVEQNPNKPTETDTFGEGWKKLDSGEKGLEALNIMRSLRSSIDTPILRQGRVVAFNNPKVAWHAAKRMGKAALSKEQFDSLHKEISSDPVYSRYSELGKEFVPDIPGVSGLREEAFPSPLAEKIPGIGRTIVAPSDRAYTAFMNSARLGHWKKNVERLEKRGLTVETNPEVFQDIARVTNLVTFRADTKNKLVEHVAKSPVFGNVFYSPRNKMSQIQILKNMMPFGSNLSSKGGLASPRNVLRKQVGQAWAINAAIYGTLAYAGIGTIEKDPESSDFLKFKVGNKRFNPWLGTNQILRAAYLLSTGQSKTLAGKSRTVSPEETAGRELRKSLAPGPGLLWDLYSGKNVVGEKVRDKEDSAEKQIFDSALYGLQNGLLPMSIDDILKEYKQSGLASSIGTVLVPGLAGENVSVYGETSDVQSVSQTLSSRKSRKKGRYQLNF